MLYNIRTSGGYYKEGPHTRRLQKLGFTFAPLDEYDTFRIMGYDCELELRNISKELSADEVIKLSYKHSIILDRDTIMIYDGYIE